MLNIERRCNRYRKEHGLPSLDEAQLGGMLEKIQLQRDKQSSSKRTSLPSLPSSITKKQSHRDRVMSAVSGFVSSKKHRGGKRTKRTVKGEPLF
jgi:hypothetical protein